MKTSYYSYAFMISFLLFAQVHWSCLHLAAIYIMSDPISYRWECTQDTLRSDRGVQCVLGHIEVSPTKLTSSV